jgi:HlyD family secretion protein
VGTQVSGILAQIYADFNDRVSAGQVLARIDTTLLASAVRAAEANLERSEAELAQAQRNWERSDRLFADQVVTEVERDQTLNQLAISRASAKAARIDLERARQNLAYTTITAPIAGTIIERDVDVGQTVAASLAAPKLFQIAGNLARLQILAAVDESDIGQIRQGQTARFTVQAYPDRTFTGTVRQVRLQSVVQDNVVNYPVVIDVDNAEGLLLPGMTATVDFIVAGSHDVLKVANAALRFKASEAMWAELRQRPGSSSRTLLWFLDEAGGLTAAPVRTGISDGQYTEISGDALREGLQVIAGTGGAASAAATASTNPFQSTRGRTSGGPPPPGGF